MTDIFIQIIFGWPAIITTILLSITGLALKKPALLVIAGGISLPFTYYVSNGLQNPFVLLPLFLFASAYAVSRQRKVIAWLLIAPLVIISALLAYAVLTQ